MGCRAAETRHGSQPRRCRHHILEYALYGQWGVVTYGDISNEVLVLPYRKSRRLRTRAANFGMPFAVKSNTNSEGVNGGFL